MEKQKTEDEKGMNLEEITTSTHTQIIPSFELEEKEMEKKYDFHISASFSH